MKNGYMGVLFNKVLKYKIEDLLQMAIKCLEKFTSKGYTSRFWGV